MLKPNVHLPYSLIGSWLRIGILCMCIGTASLLTSACVNVGERAAPTIKIVDAHPGGTIVAFNTEETLLASGGWAGEIRLFNLPDGSDAARWHAHDDSVNGLVFLQSGELLSAGYDGMLIRWRRDGTPLQSLQTPAPITHMVADESRNRIVTGHSDGAVREWRMSDFSLLATQHGQAGAIRAVAFDPAGERVASSASDGSVVLWDPETGSRRLQRPPTDAWSLVFAPDGKQLYGGGWFDLYRWDLHQGTLTKLPTEHHGIIKSLDFNAMGSVLASISRQTDDSVYFLDPHSGAVVRRFAPHDLCGAYIRLSKRGHYLATTSDDGSVRVWRLNP